MGWTKDKAMLDGHHGVEYFAAMAVILEKGCCERKQSDSQICFFFSILKKIATRKSFWIDNFYPVGTPKVFSSPFFPFFLLYWHRTCLINRFPEKELGDSWN